MVGYYYEDLVKLDKPYKLNYTPFTARGFCFGCDEGRNGRVIHRKRSFSSSPRITFDEVICEGCDMIMDLFRLYIPEVIQTQSHEGTIVWLIESRIYHAWKEWLDTNNYTSDNPREGIIKNMPVGVIMIGDGGQDPEHVIRVLLKAGANWPLPKNPNPYDYNDYSLYRVKLISEINGKGVSVGDDAKMLLNYSLDKAPN